MHADKFINYQTEGKGKQDYDYTYAGRAFEGRNKFKKDQNYEDFEVKRCRDIAVLTALLCFAMHPLELLYTCTDRRR